jgi:UDP-N-acetylmuramate dehydrogenase
MEITNFRGELQRNEPLSRHTSFAIGGPAELLAYPADRADLTTLLAEIGKQGAPFFILGGGTNILVRDGGFRGVVISLRRLAAIVVDREYRSVGGSYAVLSAEAGAPLSKLQIFAAEQGLTGLEFAAGIPGTVGGAIRMNAGTAAGEIGDIIESVTVLLSDGTLTVRAREALGFSYRTSNLAENEIVLDAKVVLRRDEKEKIKTLVKGLLEKRKRYQPQGLPNAGSMFKNPQEAPAGKLIETAKLKGKTVGGAQVSEKHGNFFVNRGNATARDVLELMEFVKQTVLDVHGVRLEPEIKIIGED